MPAPDRLRLLAVPLFASLAGCNSAVMNPSGDVALQQRDLLVDSTLLMLPIIVPVIALTLAFAWHYRQSNRKARYEPEWDHSMRLELVIWAAPLLVIICLGALTWLGTHLLDPYRPIERIARGQPIPADARPLEVEVVALDWKWLFIYPQYGVASVNELAAPINRPISLRITASSVMNSLYIPEFAGQIYAMPGMETRLNGVLNRVGTSGGFSANYSGAGFSGMRLTLRSLSAEDFERWVVSARSASETLTRDSYLALEKPSQNEPIRQYGAIDAHLYAAILNMCVRPATPCMQEMMAAHVAHRTAP